MKKFLKLLVAIILAIVIIGGVMFLVDCSRGKSGNTPIFAKTNSELDSERMVYNGLGYKVISFSPTLGGGVTAEIGPWTIELKEGKDFIIDNDKVKENDEIQSGDNIEQNIVSGDIIINSGDIISGDIQSGDFVSGDEIKNEDVSGDSIDIDNSGDTNINENMSGDEEIIKVQEYYFNATVIGVNKNNIIVQALENEEITKSSDMFTFSLTSENNADNNEFLIGQKVKIQYDGNIRETYPAQIDVINIEIIE